MMTTSLAWAIGGWEWVALMVIGLLLFGRRLPEVGRNLGRGIVEFRKGIKGIEDEIEDASSAPSTKGAAQIAAASASGPALNPPAQQTVAQSPPQAQPQPAQQQPPSPAQQQQAQNDADLSNPYQSG